MTDYEFLSWLYERLVLVYRESPNMDFVQRLKRIVDEMGQADFLKDAGEQLPSLIGDSEICLAFVTKAGPDPKFCIELGYMVALDKPIIVVARPGSTISSKLAAVANDIVEWDGELADSGLSEALNRIAANLLD